LPFHDVSGPYRSAKAQLVSMQVEDNDEIDVPGLHRRSSSARYELLRQRSQVVNQQYEGAKRQLQRLVSDSSMRSSDADEFTTAELSPPLSPSSEVSGSPTKSSMMSAQSQQQPPRGVFRRSGSVNAESPTLPRLRRNQRQSLLAPTRVAPTPVVVPIATRRTTTPDDASAIVPPQYTLAPLVLPKKQQSSDNAVEAREATTTSYLACMDEMGRVRDKINTLTKAAEVHVRDVSRELATEYGNNATQLREGR
jgi:hypothetical protein